MPVTPCPSPVVPDRTLVAAHEEALRFYRAQLAAPWRGRRPRVPRPSGARVGPVPVGGPVGRRVRPGSWTRLVDHLGGAGSTDEEMLAAGLAVATHRGGVVDRFRGRVMLPIRDEDGRVVAFIGPRAARCGPGHAEIPRHPGHRHLPQTGNPVRAVGTPHPAARRAAPDPGGGTTRRPRRRRSRRHRRCCRFRRVALRHCSDRGPGHGPRPPRHAPARRGGRIRRRRRGPGAPPRPRTPC